MYTEEIIDYAMPLINIERMTKEIHDLCLKEQYVDAKTAALKLAVESRVLQHALTIMQEKKEKQWTTRQALLSVSTDMLLNKATQSRASAAT